MTKKIVTQHVSPQSIYSMLTEFRICEQGAEYDRFLNQVSEWDYV